MEIKNLRHELRKSVSEADANLLKQWMHDAEQGFTADTIEKVHSLLFEKTDNANMDNKRNGSRENFLLTYSGDGQNTITLVKKSRRKDSFLERDAQISRSECERIIAGDIAFLGGTSDPLLFELFSHLTRGDLRLRMLLDYTKESFRFPGTGTQVALESDFYTGFNTSDFLNDRHPTIQRSGPVILEVKYDKALPEILSRFACGGKPAGKYAFAYAHPGT